MIERDLNVLVLFSLDLLKVGVEVLRHSCGGRGNSHL